MNVVTGRVIRAVGVSEAVGCEGMAAIEVGVSVPYKTSNRLRVGVTSPGAKVGDGVGDSGVGQSVRVGGIGVGVYGVSGACVQVGGAMLIPHTLQLSSPT